MVAIAKRKDEAASKKALGDIVVVPGPMAGKRFRVTVSGKTAKAQKADPIVVDCTGDDPCEVPAEHSEKLRSYIAAGYLSIRGERSEDPEEKAKGKK